MDLYYIDYISVSRQSRLHRLPAWLKICTVVAIFALLLSTMSTAVIGGMGAILLILALTAGIPIRVFVLLSLYPIVFLVIIFLAMHGLTVRMAAVLSLRIVTMTGSVVLLLLSTSFPAIFGALSRVLPPFVIAALFFTYRSIFLIWNAFNDLRTAMHLRGGFDSRRPVSTLRNLGTGLGHLMVHSIEMSQRMADGLRLRGFTNRIYYMEGRDE